MTCNFIFSKILIPHVSEKQTKKKELKKLISRLSFYCHLPVVENCLKKMLVGIKRKKYSNENYTRCRKCPNTEFFLACIFPYSDWVQGFTKQICIFSSNVGKYGPEETPYLDTFHIAYSLKNPVKIAIKKSEHHPSINWVLKKQWKLSFLTNWVGEHFQRNY